MDELVKLVSQKTGLPEDKAKLAVETVLNFLKQKLPAPLAAQLDGLLDGNIGMDDIAGLASGLSGLFGKK
ncbi:MAG: hypothetical protein HPY45_12785 [Anaerolineae bacterium]|nr:hypothetical protein [Anaerolineae bacterium]